MKKSGITVGLALSLGLAAGASSAAAQGNVDGQKYDKGATVTIQGCVVAAEAMGNYALSGVKEWPISHSLMGKYGPRHYWIDKRADELGNYVGQMIQLTGTITDVTKSEIDLKDGGTIVEVEVPGGDNAISAVNAGIKLAERPDRKDVKITLLKLKVDELLVVMKTCLPKR